MKFRLLLDLPRSASFNMAMDEMLMDVQRRDGAEPCLRFYTWETPAVTCGYFQKVAEISKRFPKFPVVRRLTGGGPVQHGKDLTFSLTLKDDHLFFRGNIKDSYLKVSEALRNGLQPHYPGLDYADCRNALSPRGRGERICFDQPACYDLLLNKNKVAGSSQRHTDRAVLYQSSLFLPGEHHRTIEQVLDGFKKYWKADFAERSLTAEEIECARQIEKARYLSEDWCFLPASFLVKQSGQL